VKCGVYRCAIKIARADGSPQPATAARRDLRVMISNAANFASSCTWTRGQEILRKAVTLCADGMGRANGGVYLQHGGSKKPRDRVAANCYNVCDVTPGRGIGDKDSNYQHKRRLLAVGPLCPRAADSRLVDSTKASGRSSRKGETFGGPDPLRLAAELARERCT
jgi:hypothetical protein